MLVVCAVLPRRAFSVMIYGIRLKLVISVVLLGILTGLNLVISSVWQGGLGLLLMLVALRRSLLVIVLLVIGISVLRGRVVVISCLTILVNLMFALLPYTVGVVLGSSFVLSVLCLLVWCGIYVRRVLARVVAVVS